MSTTGDKAKRATVAIGSSSVDGIQMPGGSYRMSQAGAATTINDSSIYALRFLASRCSKALLGGAFTDYTPEQIEVEPSPGDRGQTRINALQLEVVAAYWNWQSHRGNRQTLQRCIALATHSARPEPQLGSRRNIK